MFSEIKAWNDIRQSESCLSESGKRLYLYGDTQATLWQYVALAIRGQIPKLCRLPIKMPSDTNNKARHHSFILCALERGKKKFVT